MTREFIYLKEMGLTPLWVKRNVSQDAPMQEESSWPILEKNIKNCTACARSTQRCGAMVGNGSRQAKWVFITDSPTQKEDKEGKVLVGEAGELFDKMLAAMDLERADIFILPVVRCAATAFPTTEEIYACQPYLLEQMSLLNPGMMVVMGEFALMAMCMLLEKEGGIANLRGQVHYHQEWPWVVTYAPAYLLENTAAKKMVWDDLRLAMRTLAGA